MSKRLHGVAELYLLTHNEDLEFELKCSFFNMTWHLKPVSKKCTFATLWTNAYSSNWYKRTKKCEDWKKGERVGGPRARSSSFCYTCIKSGHYWNQSPKILCIWKWRAYKVVVTSSISRNPIAQLRAHTSFAKNSSIFSLHQCVFCKGQNWKAWKYETSITSKNRITNSNWVFRNSNFYNLRVLIFYKG